MKRTLLGDIASVSSGGTPSRANPEFWGGSIPWVKTGEIRFNRIRDAEETITPAGVAGSAAKIFPARTLLMAMYGQGKTRGQVAILEIEAAINQACAAIIPIATEDTNYLYQYLAFNYRNIRRLSNSGSQENLSADLIRSIPVYCPRAIERGKIADILTTWDEALEKLDVLIDAKERRKKGLMQQLLTGKKRLPGFRDPWKKARFQDLLKIEDRYVEFDDKHSYCLVSIRRRSGGVFFRQELKGSEIKTKVMKRVHTDDFLISRMQVVHGALGMVRPECDGMYASDSYDVLVNRNPQKLHMPFLDWMSRLRSFWHLAYISSHGVHIEKMTFKLSDFMRESIRIPSNFSEQHRIAEILDTCDAELNLLRRQRDALNLQKRGLMQRLLTGKIRVTPTPVRDV